MFKWNLKKPLAVFDIESTGLNPRLDRIIDLAIVRIFPNGERDAAAYRFNPEMPIPPDATEVHGIRDEDVQACPVFRDKAAEIADILKDSDLGGFNAIRFDIPMLREEFQRADVDFVMEGRRLLDAQRIFHQRERRDLTAALSFYRDEMHLGAHGAMEDVEATIRVMEGQFERYQDLPRDMDELDRYCNPRDPSWADATGRVKWSGTRLVINFGKHQGRAVSELVAGESGFLNWILRSDFPPDTKDIIRNALEGRYPEPPKGTGPSPSIQG